jgi:hypothetical protein
VWRWTAGIQTGTSGGVLGTQQWHSWFHKMQGISWSSSTIQISRKTLLYGVSWSLSDLLHTASTLLWYSRWYTGQATDWTSQHHGSLPRDLSHPKMSIQVCGPPSLLVNGHCMACQLVPSCHDAHRSPLSGVQAKKAWKIPPLPNTPSWHAHHQLYLLSFNTQDVK